MADHGLPRSARLLSGGDFRRVFARPLFTVSCRHFLMLAAANGGGGPRLGLAVAKRRVATAVGRNRIKRLAREGFRRRRVGLPSLDLVLQARQGAGELANRDIMARLESLFADLGRRHAKGSRPSESRKPRP